MMTLITYIFVLAIGAALGFIVKGKQASEQIKNLQDDLSASLAKIAELEKSKSADESPEEDKASEEKYFRERLVVRNDLSFIAGIDTSAITFLNSRGIHTWQDLADSTVEQIREIILAAKQHVEMVVSSMSIEDLREAFLSTISGYDKYDPSTWPAQAKLVLLEDWQKLGDLLDGKISPEEVT